MVFLSDFITRNADYARKSDWPTAWIKLSQTVWSYRGKSGEQRVFLVLSRVFLSLAVCQTPGKLKLITYSPFLHAWVIKRHDELLLWPSFSSQQPFERAMFSVLVFGFVLRRVRRCQQLLLRTFEPKDNMLRIWFDSLQLYCVCCVCSTIQYNKIKHSVSEY